MSLILDALKKADDKRSQTPDQAPKPETAQVIMTNNDAINAQALKAIAIKNWGMLCVCFFLCVLIVVLVYLLLDSKQGNNPYGNHGNAVQEAQPINRVATSNTLGPAVKSVNSQNNIDSLYSQASPEHDTQLSRNTQSITQQQSDTLYKNIASTKPNLNSNLHSANAAQQRTNNIKDIKNTSQLFQQNVSTIFYSEHSFPIEGEPSVVLNKRTLFEGDSLDNGIYVHAILEDKVILIKDNQYFSLQARNSWINF